jgi:site-specific DNA-methyltransferase (adenine-specific)
MTWTVHHGDCVAGLAGLERGSVDLIFADPPYNIGIDYGEGARADRRPSVEYVAWMRDWINAAALALSPTGSLWIVCGQEQSADHDKAIQAAGLTIRNRITWYETFGNNCQKKFNRTSRPVYYAVKNSRHFTFNRDAVTTPSARQTKYRDRRAAAGGKLLDDVWTIPRVCGTHRARVAGVPTQIPEEMLRRVVLCSSNPDDLVVDPFTGSGTTGAVSVKHGRRFVGWELREQFVAIARSRIAAAAAPPAHPSPLRGQTAVSNPKEV